MVTFEVSRMDSLVIFIFAIFLIDKGESLKCYTCHTEEHPNCTDISNSNEFKPRLCNYKGMSDGTKQIFGIQKNDDPHLKYACIRYDVSDGKGKNVVVRDCSLSKTRQFDPCQYYEKSVEFANKISKLANKVVRCSVCDTDSCNGAESTSGTMSTKFSCILAISIMCIIFTSWLGV